MIAEFGVLSLALACMIAIIMTGVTVWMHKAKRKHAAIDEVSFLMRRLAISITFLLSTALFCLALCFAGSDFSVANVYENSHTAKPLIYKITATWGSHEGSMLLWVWVLGMFMGAYATKESATRKKNPKFYSSCLGVLAGISIGFLLFILLTSNPFARVLPVPAEGQGLNPLLQDIGLAIHPPLLYLGYVGFCQVFALAVAGLLSNSLGQAWAKHCQPWVLLAWSFLTAGIGMGSWWAYRELGWGGWWFWDPVENVSLLPWLSGTALLHALFVYAKRDHLRNWTALLALFTFICSLLGTFLVRSGVLSSVHSFANDPTRGLFVLCFIVLIITFSLWLYAARYPRSKVADFSPLSREGSIMANNLLLMVLCGTLLLSLLYPMLLQAFNMPGISVGAPYYNQIMLPAGLLLALLAGFAPLLPWKKSSWKALSKPFAMTAACAIIALIGWQVFLPFSTPLLAMMGVVLGAWTLAASVTYFWRQLRHNKSKRSPFAQWLGMGLAHAGFGLLVLSVSLSAMSKTEFEKRINLHETVAFAGYKITLQKRDSAAISNYTTHRAYLQVSSPNAGSFTLEPETRFYPERRMETTEAALKSFFTHDLYAAIRLSAATESAPELLILKLYYLPGMLWLWIGFIFASVGGSISAIGYFRAQRP